MADPLETLFATRRPPVPDLPAPRPDDTLSAPQPTGVVLCIGPPKAPPPKAAPSATVLNGGAGQWLVVSERDTAAQLMPQYADRAMAADISHARFRIRVQGPRARGILQSGIPIDLDPEVLAIGTSTPTAFRDVAVVLHARAEDTFDLYVFRSYARSLWEWLQDVARAGSRGP